MFMNEVRNPVLASHQEQTREMLLHLQFPVHRNGYKQLCVGVPLFARDPFQSLTKELYPAIARELNCGSSKAVEHCIRDCTLYAYEHRDPEVWEQYFPNSKKPPSNKQFLSALAERMK